MVVGAARNAVTIGVTGFDGLPDLEFGGPQVAELIAELSAVLSELGYATTVANGERLEGRDLGGLVDSGLTSAGADGLAIVHVLSHGVEADGGATVYVLGSDGKPVAATDVQSWLAGVQNLGDRPRTLFLLDLCHSGRAARLPWQIAVEQPRSWVIAACQPDQAAFDGRLTRATIAVLREIAEKKFDTDESVEHIPVTAVGLRIRQKVNELTGDGYAQHVTGSPIDITAPSDVPFFRNPRYRGDNPRRAVRSELDDGLLPLYDDLDEGLDARHFIDRVAGTRIGDGPLVGCFTGRDVELKQLSPWMAGHGEGPLRVVTGSAGVGKSALLGLLVCAAHPTLRRPTKPLWDRASQAPFPHDEGIAAVHARGRTLAQTTESLARQLGVQAASPAELIAAIRELPGTQLIAVDALDEAVDGEATMSKLLLPLVTGDGPGVRLLVGARPYEQFRPLLDAGVVVDLDTVDRDVLHDDLETYLTDLLRTVPAYRAKGAVRGGFASAVASTLAANRKRGGEFLVAGLYARYFVAAHAAKPLADPHEAERFGSEVPRTLPEVLDLDLSLRTDRPLLRPVLSTVACAYGQGMPERVAARLLGAEAGDVRDAVDAGSFYLRRSMDADGTVLYRLFHQELVDHLRAPADDLLDRLLAVLGPPDARDWSLAEPYVLRHAPEHAEDVGRGDEITFDPEYILQTTGEARSDLALFAARASGHALAARIANPRGGTPLTWQPRWAHAEKAVRVQAGPLLVETSPFGRSTGVRGLGVVEWQGRRVVLMCHVDGHLAVWDPAAGKAVHEIASQQGSDVAAVAFTMFDGKPHAVTANENGIVRLWNLTARFAVGHMFNGHSGPVRAMVCSRWRGSGGVFLGGEDGVVELWDLPSRSRVEGFAWIGSRSPITAIAQVESGAGTTAVIGTAEGTAHVRDLDTRETWSLPPHDAAITALAAAHLGIGRRPAIAVGDASGQVSVWDLSTRERVRQRVLASGVTSMFFDDSGVLMIGDASGGVSAMSLTSESSGDRVPVHPGEVGAITLVPGKGRATMVTAGPASPAATWTWPSDDRRPEPAVTARETAILSTGDQETLVVNASRHLLLLDVASGAGSVIQSSHKVRQPRWLLRPQDNRPLLHDGRIYEIGEPRGGLIAITDLESGATRSITVPPDALTVHTALHISGEPLIATAGPDATVRFWRLDGTPYGDDLSVPGPVFSLAATSSGELIVGYRNGDTEEITLFRHISAVHKEQRP